MAMKTKMFKYAIVAGGVSAAVTLFNAFAIAPQQAEATAEVVAVDKQVLALQQQVAQLQHQIEQHRCQTRQSGSSLYRHKPLPIEKSDLHTDVSEQAKVADDLFEQGYTMAQVHRLARGLSDAIAQAHAPERLLMLAQQARYLKGNAINRQFAQKLLQSALELDEVRQEQMLHVLKASLGAGDIEALAPFIHSPYEDVQEEAYLRLSEMESTQDSRMHFEFLAYNGHSEWVRAQAEKQLAL